MSQPTNIHPRIIEGLYCEALILSDEVRAIFDLSHSRRSMTPDNDDGSLALSCEALRTTTRMMHAIAWLLNHRAFLAGELSEFQLRRHGRLVPDFPAADPDRLAMLSPEVCRLITCTEAYYARLLRVDRGWRTRNPAMSGAVERLRSRLAGQGEDGMNWSRASKG